MLRTLSVVIPSYNMARELGHSLRFLAAQALPPGVELQVIAVDDGSSDETREVVADAVRRLPVEYVHRPRDADSGRSRARNLGIARARGELITFLDAGVVVGPEFVAEVARAAAPDRAQVHEVLGLFAEWPAFAADKVAPEALAAAVAPLREHEGWRDDRRASWDLVGGDLERLPAPWGHGWTCALTVPRAAVAAVGGFDESFRGWGAEDIDFSRRIHAAGVRFAVVDAPTVVHLPHPRAPSAELEASLLTNRHRLHAKVYALETEVFVLYGGLNTNIVVRRLEALHLEHAIPFYPPAALSMIRGVIGGGGGGGGRLAVIAPDRAATAAALGAETVLLPSRRLARAFAAQLPGCEVSASLGCHTRYADRAFDTVVVSDAIRLFDARVQREIMREALRVGARAFMLETALDTSMVPQFRVRYRACDGWGWSDRGALAETARGVAGLVGRGACGDTTVVELLRDAEMVP